MMRTGYQHASNGALLAALVTVCISASTRAGIDDWMAKSIRDPFLGTVFLDERSNGL